MAKTMRRDAAPLEPALEVIDALGTPLLVMPSSQVSRQRLAHKAVLVCLRDRQNRIYLHQRNAASRGEGHGLWFASAFGPVHAGESRYAAACRLLETRFGITGLEVFSAAQFTAGTGMPGTSSLTVFLTAKTSIIPQRFGNEKQEGMFVDKEEMAALAHGFPQMLPPFFALAAPYLFA